MVFKLSVDLGSELALAWSTKLQMCTRQREIETEMSGGGGLVSFFSMGCVLQSHSSTVCLTSARILSIQHVSQTEKK